MTPTLSVEAVHVSATELSEPFATRFAGCDGGASSPVTTAVASFDAALMFPAASSAVTR